MLNSIIATALRQRVLTITIAIVLMAYGSWQALQLPIDVFPDLNRPRVTIITEAPGMVPEEIEREITLPLERAINGAAGVLAIRSTSYVGLSIVYAEFDWGTDVYVARQLITERLGHIGSIMPPGIEPELAPISSITGQIMIVGLWSDTGETSPMQLRNYGDWLIRPRLQSIGGVAQVITMGGERMQYQVLVNPYALLDYDVTLHEVETALEQSNLNVTGGYLDQQGSKELQVRALGRLGRDSKEVLTELENLVVQRRDDRSVQLRQVARVTAGAQVKRGDSYAYVRDDVEDPFRGGPAVTLVINKQPGADTRKVTHQIEQALQNIPGLPGDVSIHAELYQQAGFIDRAIENVAEAILHGSVLVVVILFLFLMNFRTTFITLTAIPLSIAITAIVFKWFGLSINTMTLGGLAVAIGELVDDAIVDVENIFRRLRENTQREQPRHALVVVYEASCEIRNSIVFGTLIVVMVFTPLFFLTGMEGRLFTPLGIAYIVSILSSLVVSLTVTPVLSYWLLGSPRFLQHRSDGWLLRGLKRLAAAAIRISVDLRYVVLLLAVGVVAASGLLLWNIERDFLPPFNEGTVQINVVLAPGTSIARSREVADIVDRKLQEVPEVMAFVSRTGRAEEDEHAMAANVTEIIATLDESERSRGKILEDIRKRLGEIPGIITSVEQPLAHLISHMLTGVKSQIGIKLYGEDLSVLRAQAEQIGAAISRVPGVADPVVEQQVSIPQLQIKLDRNQLAVYGLTPYDVNEFVETALNGRVVSQVLQGQRRYDLLVRFEEEHREDVENLDRLLVTLPGGRSAPLGALATIRRFGGPNVVNHEQVQRRIVIQCNTTGQRGLVNVVEDIQRELEPIETALPAGYFIEYGGQFESQQRASRVMGIVFAAALVGMFLLLYVVFRSANFALQVMAALPMAFIGAVAALLITDQTLSIAAMVGFISLCGIAVRNGILLLNHYLYLARYEDEPWSPALLVRAGQERLAPVLMTALTSGIGLVPLALAAGEPGKEILYPVATVMIGGLISSTLLEFLVRPALFSVFGFDTGRRLVSETAEEADLESLN